MNIIPKTAYLNTPLGWLSISGTAEGVETVRFVQMLNDMGSCCPGLNTFINFSGAQGNAQNLGLPEPLVECVAQLDEYFKGQRKVFELKLNPKGTDFRKSVWKELSKIKFGETSTYLNIAKAIGDENAVRAVGNANGKNPLWIVVPCHRIIGSDGSLTGYAGGIWRKRWLLDFEKEQHGLF